MRVFYITNPQKMSNIAICAPRFDNKLFVNNEYYKTDTNDIEPNKSFIFFNGEKVDKTSFTLKDYYRYFSWSKSM